jgi:hypothetical protein
MTATLEDVTRKKERPEPTAEQRLAEEMVLGVRPSKRSRGVGV